MPDRAAGAGRSAWLGPYLAAARVLPLVLCRSQSAAEAEAAVAQLVGHEGLRPRTVTVLADYGSIGCNLVELEAPPPQGHYEVRTEPCVPVRAQQTAAVGVGRIPLESLADASVLVARGLLRDRLLAGRPLRLLMVSNSGIVRRPLPLCETISRVTAAEFKNCGVRVDEFYGTLADSPQVMAAARSASLIIYEGHSAYQDLFDVPTAHRATMPDWYFDEELDMLDEGGQRAAGSDQRAAGSSQQSAVSGQRSAVSGQQLSDGPAAAGAATYPVTPPRSSRLQGPMRGLPIVVLQGCGSLEEPVLWRIDELGGAAVVGSFTAIHSGSGSALVQAVADAVLYDGCTLGEAMRDAQNYLLCLEDLKGRRGYTEQAKGQRVALSFRLWGDPEMCVLPGAVGRPARAPVAIAWTGPDTLAVHIPDERLPECRSSKYVAHMFPGSEAAGIVRREGDALKRLAAVYFFRVPLPQKLPSPSGGGTGGEGNGIGETLTAADRASSSPHPNPLPEGEGTGLARPAEVTLEPRRRPAQSRQLPHRPERAVAVRGLLSRAGEAGRVDRVAAGPAQGDSPGFVGRTSGQSPGTA